MILEGKTVVVTGVGPGLGREVAEAALRDGANVFIGARQEERLQAIAKELDATGKRVGCATLDITDPERNESFMTAAIEKFGRIDALAQVAAYDTLFGTLQSTSIDDWMSALKVNVVGTTQVARAAVPHLKRAGGGSIVLVGSLSMWLSPDNPQIAYASSKGAILSSMYSMAEELGPDKIRVNMVIPTWMWGPPVEAYVKWQANERSVSEDVIKAEITANMPLGEIPKDDDVAEAIVFFCSDRARMITGETLQVNAGQLMR